MAEAEDMQRQTRLGITDQQEELLLPDDRREDQHIAALSSEGPQGTAITPEHGHHHPRAQSHGTSVAQHS